MTYIVLGFFISCKAPAPDSVDVPVASGMEYAKGFDLQTYTSHSILYIFRQSDEQIDTLTYLLYPKGHEEIPAGDYAGKIPIPLQKIACLSGPYLAMAEALGATENIVAVSNASFIFSSELRNRVEVGLVQELGGDAQVNVEAAVTLDPDLILYSAFPGMTSKPLDQLQRLGISNLPLAEWQENTLLGRAEWIKLIGALLQKEQEASDLFEHMKSEYLQLIELVGNAEHSPKILSSLPFKGLWSVPGGNSYMAHVFEDAGASYHWADTPQKASIPLSFEAVYPIGVEAEIWISPGTAQSYSQLLGQDERFQDFLSVKERKVFHNYKRSLPTGGNDYWEGGVIQPHIVLKDLIKILHPELLPDHEWVFYAPLRE